MEISLKGFKERFYNGLIEIHWKHWSALGVSTHVKPERFWIVDLEPLVISTLSIGLHDKRLLSSSLEWLIKNGEWLNLSRLRKILKVYMEPFPGLKQPIVSPKLFRLLVDSYNKNARSRITYKKEEIDDEEDRIKEYEIIFNNFRMRGIVTKPKLRDPSLLQILLRSFFGVVAQVELFIYLLVNDDGNSNSIARETFYDQKNVYRILERWANAQVVTKISENKATLYSLNRKNEFVNSFGLKKLPRYLNWTWTFLLLNRIGMALSTPPWAEDEYLLSSFFRDLSGETQKIGKVLNVKVPDPQLFLGKKFFTPFVVGILNILKHLMKGA